MSNELDGLNTYLYFAFRPICTGLIYLRKQINLTSGSHILIVDVKVFHASPGKTGISTRHILTQLVA